jgi:hypothetical protein
MKKYGGVEVYLHSFLTSVIDEDELSVSCPGCFTPGERAPRTQWLDHRAGLDMVVNRKKPPSSLPGIES